ncbi:terpene synthase family protein [Streptomyces sp. NPDC059783]|uniref:terpene synthase family protein n=1 Tax=Streptomyces sp. NPDC059783 TaxID=3346944 RepID=UPI00364AC0DD
MNIRSTAAVPHPMPDLGAAFPGPFPASPHATAVENGLRYWAGEHQLPVPTNELRTLCAITSQGIARALPTAGLDSLQLAADLFLWLVAFDDTHGELAAAADPTALAGHVNELTAVLAGNTPTTPAPARPFTTALRDLLDRITVRATPSQYLTLTGHLHGSLLGLLWEAHHLNDPSRVTLRTYHMMRPLTVFARTLTAIAPIALSYELPERADAMGAVERAESETAVLAGWVNDLASYHREASRSTVPPLSLPTLLMHEHHLELPEAFTTAAGMCERQAVLIRAHIDELSTGDPGPLTRHAQALEHIVHAFIWHIRHDRYSTP